MRKEDYYEERDYLKEFIWLWIKVVIFYLIGGWVGCITGNGFNKSFALGVAFVLFGFAFFEKVVPFNLFGNHDSVIWFWIIKVIISFVIGIFAFPVVNIYYIIMIVCSIVRAVNKKED